MNIILFSYILGSFLYIEINGQLSHIIQENCFRFNEHKRLNNEVNEFSLYIKYYSLTIILYILRPHGQRKSFNRKFQATVNKTKFIAVHFLKQKTL